MKTLEFMFQSFWTWLGCMAILYVLVHYSAVLINRIMRQININKHGYPPPYCDADGNFRTPIDDNDDE